MGYDCSNYLPPDVSRKDVEEFILLLGYTKLPRGEFSVKSHIDFYYNPDDYKYLDGVYASICTNSEGLCVYTRCSIWRGRYDNDFQNYTIRQLKKRFGGYFISDRGKNRYFKDNGPYIDKEEGGCYQAYSKFIHKINLASSTVETWRKSVTKDCWYSNVGKSPTIDSLNPLIVTSNIVLPFLIATIEDYFRSIYIALLKYSPEKDAIIKDARIQTDELILVSKDEIKIEDAVARSRSFQNMRRINQSFREIDNRIDIHEILNKPYRRRRQSIYETFENIISHRHFIIHQAEIICNYTPQSLVNDINTTKAGIERIYLFLINLYGWSKEHPDLPNSYGNIILGLIESTEIKNGIE